MRIEVINTGTELLLGKVVNTHVAFFGDELFKLNLRIQRQTTIPDGHEIHEALDEAFPRSDLILVTGGLGPTNDDITREVVAGLLGRTLKHDPAVWRHIRALFRLRGIEANAENERQAMVPEGASVMDNPYGTAPGLYLPAVPDSSPHLFLMPGPPRELKPMFLEKVLPRLREILGPEAAPQPWRNFKIHGVGESAIAEAVQSRLAAIENLEFGYCCRLGEVDLRLIGSEPVIEEASKLVREAFGEQIVTESEDPIEKVVIDLLSAAGKTLATAESCTGGLIASTVTDVAGSSDVFLRGYVTYANESKTELLGVPPDLLEEHGAVSEPVASAMASGCLERSGADFALAVSGIAGPGGGTEEKPVGTVFIGLAIRGRSTTVAGEYFPLDRRSFKTRVTRHALDMLRRSLRDSEGS